MHSMTITTRSTLSLALIALAGCFGLNRGDPSQRHFVLGLAPSPAGVVGTEPAGGVPGAAVGLRPLRLAGYLESPLIVVRRGPHRVELSEFHRWGEALDQGISRTVASYMEGQGSFRRVAYAPWPTRSQQDYLIQLQILRFEGSAPDGLAVTEGEALLLASWEILRGDDGVLLARGTTEYHGPGWALGDYEGLVGLLESGLSQLAHDLVTALADLRLP